MTSGPIQRLVRVLVVLVSVCVLGLVAGIVLVSIENAQTNDRLHALEEYVQGKGQQRDRENARLQEQIRQAQCDLLDTFPEGGLLDRARAKYGCGPGLPLDQLTPSEQAQITPHPPAVVLPRPQIGPQPPTTPTPPPAAAPPASPPPPTSGPVTNLLCGLLPLNC